MNEITVYQGLPFDVSVVAGVISQNSLDAYTADFKEYVQFSRERNLDALVPYTLILFRSHLVNETAHSPNTINRKLSAIKSLMEQASKGGYITREAKYEFKEVEGVRVEAMVNRTKQHARTRIEPADMRKLTNSPGTDTLKGLRDTAILHTLASSGLRCEEVATLRTDQIRQSGNGYLLSVRGKNEKTFNDAYLSVTAYHAIQSWLSARSVDSEFVFTSFEGKKLVDGTVRESSEHISGVGVWKLVQKYADICNLSHIKPHDFRRFVGTELTREYDIRKAQKALRHKNIKTTADHYVLDELEVGLTDNLY